MKLRNAHYEGNEKKKVEGPLLHPACRESRSNKTVDGKREINKVRENRCIAFHPSSLSVTHRYTAKKKKKKKNEKKNLKPLLFDRNSCRNVLLLLLFKIFIVCLLCSLTA